MAAVPFSIVTKLMVGTKADTAIEQWLLFSITSTLQQGIRYLEQDLQHSRVKSMHLLWQKPEQMRHSIKPAVAPSVHPSLLQPVCFRAFLVAVNEI